MGNRGIIVEYKIDKNYFKYGEAYRLKLGVNHYVNAICTNVEDDKVTFGYHNKDSFDILTLTLSDLMYRNGYDIRRLKVDYEHGVFKFEL